MDRWYLGVSPTLYGQCGVSKDAVKQPDAAEALIKHLTAPNAVPVMKAKAMEPVAQ